MEKEKYLLHYSLGTHTTWQEVGVFLALSRDTKQLEARSTYTNGLDRVICEGYTQDEVSELIAEQVTSWGNDWEYLLYDKNLRLIGFVCRQ